MEHEKAEYLRGEVRELEALIAKADRSDPEACWAAALLSVCLRRRRQELQEAVGRAKK